MAIDLSLNLFLRVNEDFEKRQYLILHALQKISRQFRGNELYPELAELVQFYNQLNDIKAKLEKKRESFPKRIKRIDLENKHIEYEEIHEEQIDVAMVKSLIDWAEPHIQEVIEEGTAVYDYVDERTGMEGVGIIPEYKDEGFMMVPDQPENRLNIFRYKVSLFYSSNDTYRALRTTFLKNMRALSPAVPLNKIKLDLVRENSELPNPATYSFNVEAEVPFKRTVLPIVKRKMIRHLYGGRENAG